MATPLTSTFTMRLLLPLLLCVSQCSYGTNSETAICDDGLYDVESDLGGEENWKCMINPFSLKALYLPAGNGECSTSNDHEFEPVCMQHRLQYQEQPPSHGSYRPLAPKYGEYRYLPPQRWLHTLKLGGVAFLYHPCAHSDQVEQLKDLARSCLNRYVVTPYPHLTEELPLAVVTWGCMYRLLWVNPEEVKPWLLARGVQYAEDTQNKVYDRDLLKEAEPQSFESLCLHHIGGPVTSQQVPTTGVQSGDPATLPLSVPTPPPSPCEARGGSNATPPCVVDHTIKSLHRHRQGLTVLLVLLGLVLLGFVLLLLFKVFSTWRTRRPRNQKYKSVSRYFPFSYEKQATEVVIPAVGMPKTGAAERQVLLNASDEDEL